MNTNIEIQLVVGTSREGDGIGWTTIPMSRAPSGWYGSFETEIEGKPVRLSIHLPLAGAFDHQAPSLYEEANEIHAGAEPELGDYCPLSQRVDGKVHSWRFDGDNPYVICVYCNEFRDALTNRVITPGRTQ
jgi:hypothetical protein